MILESYLSYMKVVLILFFSLTLLNHGQAQDTTSRIITIPELFSLTEANSKQLEVALRNIEISKGRTDIAKSDRLPEIETSVDAGYLSTIAILNPDFSWHSNVKTPHFTNNYYLEASQIVYKGGYIQQNIAKYKLSEQLAALNFEKDRQEIKLLLLGRYLDLFQLFNGRKIYLKNIELAQKRLYDLQKLKREGLVTQNDVIRSELQIADFKLDLDEIDNNIQIINNDLAITIGISGPVKIIPDTSLVNQPTADRSLADYLASAYALQPAMKAMQVSEKIAAKNVELEKSARLPVLSLYAGNALQRPFLYTLDPLDIYYNSYQAGLKLKYNISSIYHAKDHIRVAKLEYEQQQVKSVNQSQQTEIEVNTAFVKYKEAKEHYVTLTKSLELADDNFRIVEKKYINQLAQITDMLDASTAKLSAELRLSNARIGIISQWYRLQKSAGNF